jgi:hypothetical protein
MSYGGIQGEFDDFLSDQGTFGQVGWSLTSSEVEIT